MGRYGAASTRQRAGRVRRAVCDRRKPWLKYLGVLGITGALGIFFYYIYIESWTLAFSVFALAGKYASVATPEDMGRFLGSYLSGTGDFFRQPLDGLRFLSRHVRLQFLDRLSRHQPRHRAFLQGRHAAAVSHGGRARDPRVYAGRTRQPGMGLNRALGFLWNPDFAALKSGKVRLEAAGRSSFPPRSASACF